MGFISLGEANQDYIIARVQDAMRTTPCGSERAAAINNGLCYMLSIEWLKIVFEKGLIDANTNDVRDQLKKFNMKEQVDKNFAYYKMLANNYICYLENHQVLTKQQGSNDLVFADIAEGKILSDETLDKIMVEMCSENRMTIKNTYQNGFQDNAEAQIIMAQIFSAAKVQNFLLSVNWSGNGHLMAGTCLPEGAIIFYDPNNGVYRMDTAGDLMEWICGKYKVESFRLLDVG